MKPTLLLAAVLMTSLAACASVSSSRPAIDAGKIAGQLSRMCPTPTPDAKLNPILNEIDAAGAAGHPPNVLATEWERLDEAARKCREAK